MKYTEMLQHMLDCYRANLQLLWDHEFWHPENAYEPPVSIREILERQSTIQHNTIELLNSNSDQMFDNPVIISLVDEMRGEVDSFIACIKKKREMCHRLSVNSIEASLKTISESLQRSKRSIGYLAAQNTRLEAILGRAL